MTPSPEDDRLPRSRRPMTDAMLEAVALRFRALSEPARLRLLEILLGGEASVGDLVEASGSSQASTSKHLATLHEAGFLKRRKKGSTVFYSVVTETVPQLCDLMCSHVNDHVSSHVESLVVARRGSKRG